MSLDVSDCLFSYPALCDCLQDLERSIRYDPASFGLRSGTPMVLSLGFAVDAIDPLQVLRAWVDPEVCHFYFEQSGQAVISQGLQAGEQVVLAQLSAQAANMPIKMVE